VGGEYFQGFAKHTFLLKLFNSILSTVFLGIFSFVAQVKGVHDLVLTGCARIC
jgi:hypothetical protein